jgi:4-hydroxybenzoyl-CoA thioesterase
MIGEIRVVNVSAETRNDDDGRGGRRHTRRERQISKDRRMRKNHRKLSVDWGHCDPAGIVFYPQYFMWFDACTAHYFASVGLPPHIMFKEQHLAMPLVDVHAKFSSPSRFGDVLDAETEIAEWGRSSLKVAHRFYNAGKLAVEGMETRVWALPHPDDPSRIKAGAIPDDVKARFE